MVLSHIFFYNILIISLMLILGYFGSRALLTWSEYLSREYENELDTFIPVTRPVAENKWHSSHSAFDMCCHSLLLIWDSVSYYSICICCFPFYGAIFFN